MAGPVTAVAEPRPLVDAPKRMEGQRLQLSISTINGVAIVRVSGAVSRHAAGRLYDTLVNAIGDGRANLIVDLSHVSIVTRAGVRGLIVAAKLMQHASGDMRICGAQQSIEGFLRGLGFNHLLKCDPTLKVSMAALSAGPKRTVTASAVITPEPGVNASANTRTARTTERVWSRPQQTTAVVKRRRKAR